MRKDIKNIALRLADKFLNLFSVLLFLFFFISCTVEPTRSPIDLNIAGPIDIAFSSDTFMYIANANIFQDFIGGSLLVLNITDPLNPVKEDSVELPLFSGRIVINDAVLPDQLFVTNRFSDDDADTVDRVFELSTAVPILPTETRVVDVFDDPFGIDIVPAGLNTGLVCVTILSFGQVECFDGSDPDSVSEEINLISLTHDGTLSSAIAISPDGSRGIVSNITQNLLYVLDLTAPDDLTLEAVLSINLDTVSMPNFRDILWLDNDRFVVSNWTYSGLFLFDLSLIFDDGPLPDDDETEEILIEAATNIGVSLIPLTDNSAPLALARVGNLLYVTEYNKGRVSIINLITLAVESTILSGGQGPVAIRLEPGNRYLYVANQTNSRIGIVDSLTNELVGSFN